MIRSCYESEKYSEYDGGGGNETKELYVGGRGKNGNTPILIIKTRNIHLV